MPQLVTDLILEYLGPTPFGDPVSPHWTDTRRWALALIDEEIGSTPVEDLGPQQIWALRHALRGRGFSVESVNKAINNVFGSMLGKFEAYRKIPLGTRATTFRGVKPLRRVKDMRCRALTIEERDRIVEAAKGTHASAHIQFLFYSGLRPGEMFALRQDSIQWARRLCAIAGSRRGAEVSEGKCENARRFLRLPRVAIAVAAPFRQADAPEAPLFPSPQGSYTDYENWTKRYFKPVVRAAGFPKMVPYDCRHTFATICLEGGEHPAPLAAYLGHTVDVLLERYGHVLPSNDLDKYVQAKGLGQRDKARLVALGVELGVVS